MKQTLVLFSLLLSFLSLAQTEKKKTEKDKVLPIANQEYSEKKYTEAEANYRISSSKGLSGTKASYNLGNAIYKQKYPSEAKIAYLQTIEKSTSKEEKHRAFHNLGNAYMTEKRYDMAVEAYKNALRNNPADEETRYNYALAKQMLKDNPPKNEGGNDKNKDKKDKQDKNQNKDQQKNNENGDEKDKQNQDGKEDKKDSKPKEGEDNKEGKNDKGEAKPQQGGMPKERVENILDAVNNNEKQVQEKMNLKKVKAKPTKTEKDW
jgi:tetratricopeptide (TPR) repeat protein